MSGFKKKITVFTPTYNRKYIIHRLFESLCRQTFRDFEWLIVDDGSSDGTEELVLLWQKEACGFPIRFYKQSQNGGKCRAINRALDLSQGELFIIVDSDDYLVDDALEKVVGWERELPKNEKFCGLVGNCVAEKSITEKSFLNCEYFDGTLLDRYKTIKGERVCVFYTDIHRKYKYPEFEGENFMTEAVAWNRMANDGFRVRFYNDIIVIYEYQQDGLTQSKKNYYLENPHGYALWLKEKIVFEGAGFRQMIKYYYTMYVELCSKYNVDTIADCLQTNVLFIYLCQFVYRIKNPRT